VDFEEPEEEEDIQHGGTKMCGGGRGMGKKVHRQGGGGAGRKKQVQGEGELHWEVYYVWW